jgi:hypothetical protein
MVLLKLAPFTYCDDALMVLLFCFASTLWVTFHYVSLTLQSDYHSICL